MTSMRALLLPPLSDSNNNDNDTRADTVMPKSEGEKQIAANFAILTANKRRKIVDEQLALETASLVEQEVQRWQNSIRELEALLEETEDRGDRNAAHQPAGAAAAAAARARYPMPAIVALDDFDSPRPANTPVEQEARSSDKSQED